MSIQRFSLVRVQRTEIECLGCDDSGSWVHYDDHLDDRAEAVAAARREALEEAALAVRRAPLGFYSNPIDLRPHFAEIIRALAQKEAPRE